MLGAVVGSLGGWQDGVPVYGEKRGRKLMLDKKKKGVGVTMVRSTS